MKRLIKYTTNNGVSLPKSNKNFNITVTHTYIKQRKNKNKIESIKVHCTKKKKSIYIQT